jgi:hypothetical protein
VAAAAPANPDGDPDRGADTEQHTHQRTSTGGDVSGQGGEWRRPDAFVEFVARRLLEDDAETTAQGDTLHGAQQQLSVAVRRLGFTLLLDLRKTWLRSLADAHLKRMATRYDDHPDFSEWWRR